MDFPQISKIILRDNPCHLHHPRSPIPSPILCQKYRQQRLIFAKYF